MSRPNRFSKKSAPAARPSPEADGAADGDADDGALRALLLILPDRPEELLRRTLLEHAGDADAALEVLLPEALESPDVVNDAACSPSAEAYDAAEVINALYPASAADVAEVEPPPPPRRPKTLAEKLAEERRERAEGEKAAARGGIAASGLQADAEQLPWLPMLKSGAATKPSYEDVQSERLLTALRGIKPTPVMPIRDPHGAEKGEKGKGKGKGKGGG